MSVRVTPDDFDPSGEIAALTDDQHDIGAIATFVGKVRGGSEGGRLASLTLEHYPGMTEARLARIEADAVARFGLNGSRIVHRVGTLSPGDNIVLVVTAAPHRGDAFAAAEFLMDYLKTEAPFWKKERYADGREKWVEARDSDAHSASRWQSGKPPRA